MKINGAQQVLNALVNESVKDIFLYPGGVIVPIIDLLKEQDEIRVILGRHEQGLAHAAEGYAKSINNPAVVLVSSGPGATNLVTAIADAYYDGIPVIFITGQVARHLIGNDAFQEVDIVGVTRGITKHSVMVKSRSNLSQTIKEAFYIANTGRKGPVLIDIPYDILLEEDISYYPDTVNIRSYKPVSTVHLKQIKKAVSILSEAKKPVFLVGGGIHASVAQIEFEQLVNKTGIPVVTSIMGKGAIPTDNKYYIGNMGMHGSYASNMAVYEADVVFSIGARFSDRTTGKINNFAPNAKIIHIDIDTASISRNVKVDIPIVADAKLAIEQILPLVDAFDLSEWFDQIDYWNKEHPLGITGDKKLCPQDIMNYFSEAFNEYTVVSDVGQHQMWTSQFLALNHHKKFITSGGLGTMGFGLPAALGVKLANPKQNVFCFTGDGGFQMNMQELATLVIENIPITIIIFNNQSLGMVKQIQHLFCAENYNLTNLQTGTSYIPDFIKIAEAYCINACRVTSLDEFKITLTKLNLSEINLIECIIDDKLLVLPMVKSGTSLNQMILEDK